MKPAAHLQKIVLKSNADSYLLHLIETAPVDEDKRRLTSTSHPSSGSFLSAPLVRNDLRIPSHSFIDSVRLRLGIKPINVEKLRPSDVCLCGKSHNWNNIGEILCCPKACGPEWNNRHDYVKNKLYLIAKSTGHAVGKEPVVGIGKNDRTDVVVYDYRDRDSKGEPDGPSFKLQIDVAVTSVDKQSDIKGPVLQGRAANMKAKSKMNSNGAKWIHEPDRFVPAIMDTYGLMHVDLRTILKSFADNQLDNSGKDFGFSFDVRDVLKGVIINGFYQLISVALVRGVTNNINNAALRILKHNNRAPAKPPIPRSRLEMMYHGAMRREGSSFDFC